MCKHNIVNGIKLVKPRPGSLVNSNGDGDKSRIHGFEALAPKPTY